MPIIARGARRIVDEAACHVEHEVRPVAWWRAVVPAGEQRGEHPDPSRVARPECGEPVNAGRSTTWSRWA